MFLLLDDDIDVMAVVVGSRRVVVPLVILVLVDLDGIARYADAGVRGVRLHPPAGAVVLRNAGPKRAPAAGRSGQLAAALLRKAGAHAELVQVEVGVPARRRVAVVGHPRPRRHTRGLSA